MELSRISLAPYQTHVRRLSKSQLPSVHSPKSVRVRPIQIIKVSHISSIPQRLSKSDSQSAHHTTTIDSQPTSDIKLSRISSTTSRLRIKRMDLSGIQFVHDKKSLKPHTALLKKLSLIQLTPYHRRRTPLGQRDFLSTNHTWVANFRATQSNRSWLDTTNTIQNIAPPKIRDYANLFDQPFGENKKRKKKRRASLSPWFWCCGLIGTILLLSVLAAILTATLLPKPPVITTTTSMSE